MEFNRTLLIQVLNDLFTLKFSNKGQGLIEANESFDWKPILDTKPEDILSLFEELSHNDIPIDSNTKAVSVWFPLDENLQPIFSIDCLKGAACFPWELDPYKIDWDRLCDKKHILLQLSQASFYGVFYAKKLLAYQLCLPMRLNGHHPLVRYKEADFKKYRSYRFPISLGTEPKEDLRTREYNLFKMKDSEFFSLCNFLYSITCKGLISVLNCNNKSKYEVAVIGKNSNDTNLRILIINNLFKKKFLGSKISGVIEIDPIELFVEFEMFDKIPEEGIKPKDGIIFADFAKELEKASNVLNLQAKTFLFYGISPPKSKENILYLKEKDVESGAGRGILKQFIDSFLIKLSAIF